MTVHSVTVFAIALVFVIAIGCWIFLFQPIFKVAGQISIKIREDISQDIHTSHNALTTLAASAIVLTFSVMEIYSSNGVSHIFIVISSWIGFLLTVLFGMSIGILSYVEKTMSKVAVQILVKAGKKSENETFSVEDREAADFATERMFKLRDARFVFLYLQVVSFASATVLFTIFAIANVL